MIKPIKIGRRWIGPSHPTFIIAEIAQAHDGSLGLAHKHLELAARCGVDAVKFQTHIADAESTPEEPWRVQFSLQDATRFDYWKRMEFTEQQWIGLKQHADELDIVFLSSPFSERAVDILERIGMPAWKIASGEVDNPILLRRICQTGKPVLISSGMSRLEEIETAVGFFQSKKIPVALFQCTTAYPCPPEQVGLEWINKLTESYQVPVGLSDHTGEIYASLAAVTLGACLVEVHFALSSDMFGPDVPASLLPDQLKQLCQGVRAIESMLASEIDKDSAAESNEALRQTFGKSLHAARDIRSGSRIGWEDLTSKKPGIGIPVRNAESLIGRISHADLRTGERLTDSLFRPPTDSEKLEPPRIKDRFDE